MAARSNAPAKKTVKKSASPVIRRSRKTGEEVAVEMHAYVPDLSVSQRYVGRKIWGVFDKIIADTAIGKALNILLEGDTGSGKTLFGEAYASHERLPYYSLPCDVSIDPSSLFGRHQPTETAGKFRWVDGPVTWIVRNGGVLNISEINFMTPKIAASLYPLLDGRRYIPLLGHDGEVVRAHRGGGKGECWCDLRAAECDRKRVLVIADLNPNYRGTMELNAAFRNRFEFKIPWGYDDDVEERLVKYPTLREIAKKLREVEDDIRTPVSTNMLMEFEEFAMMEALSLEFAINNFVSAFLPEEQNSVKNIFELNSSKLSADIAHFARLSRRKSKAAESDEELEEIEYDFEQED